ncbi:hypothetical protein [Fervidobacterium thailandense]|uniref:Uncharacterized protein n=1 Tax=Fervidobacterium thailandense TaxID=1008305 RepID=A0A1E3G3F6_9BACT|nr:hypothetical protein [Fervidobacterium thailandense]ODN30806.1 hypothetical protein A4H02_02735 [Fervidobacterium thailandense]
MDFSLTGILSALVVLIILMALLGVLFNLVLSNLEQSRLQMNFYSEAQRIVNLLNLRLTNAVWTDPNSMGLATRDETYSFRLAFYNPETLTLQYKTLSYDRNSRTLRLDNQTLLSLSSDIESLSFRPFYRDERLQTPECVLMIVRPRLPRLREYTFPILTYLSGSY